MLRRTLHLLVALALFSLGAVPLAFAQGSRLQLGTTRRLKACIGIIPTQGEPPTGALPNNPWSTAPVNSVSGRPDPDGLIAYRSPNPNPYVFFVMNQRKDLLPDGWEISNPAAPPFVTQQQQLRWEAFISGPNTLRVGTPLSPDYGAYWEEEISEGNYNALSQMDVIYLPIARTDSTNVGSPGAAIPTFFTEEQRRVLAALANAGVTIWVDYGLRAPTVNGVLGGNEPPAASASPVTRLKNAFFTNIDFVGGNTTALPPLVEHPLLNAQYRVPAAQAVLIGSTYGASLAPSVNRAVETRSADLQPTANFTAVVPTSGGPPTNAAYVAAARYGAGYVVATAGNVGGAISTLTNGNLVGSPIRPIILPTVARATNEDLGLAEDEDLKFAYNVFAWAGEVTAAQKNSQHTGESSVQINGLIEQFSYPNLIKPGVAGGLWQTYPPAGMPLGSLPPNPVPPLILNGAVIAQTRYRDPVSGSIVTALNMFEQNPNEDFDRSGTIDDPGAGIPPAGNPYADLSIGLPYDRVMGFPGIGQPPLTGFFTGMCVGEVPEPTGGPGGSGGAKAFVFAAGTAGLVSLPAPRPNMPPTDFWDVPGVPQVGPNLNIAYTGAPAFANAPGQNNSVNSLLFAGGTNNQAAFGGSANGKLAAFNVAPSGALQSAWYYPSNQESNRLGAISGPVTTAEIQDRGTGAADLMVLATSVSTGDTTGGGGGNPADTTGRVLGWVVATHGEPLSLPLSQNPATANNLSAGRRFVPLRLLSSSRTPGAQTPGQAIEWDPTRHFEVRVMDKARNYVLARFVPGSAGFQPLSPATLAGVIELPPPTGVLSRFALPGQPNTWNTNDFVLVADYSVRPRPVDNGGATLAPSFQPATPYERGPSQNQAPPTGVAGGVSVGRDNLIYYGTGIGYMVAAELQRGQAAFRWKARSREYDPNGGLSTNVDPTSPGFLDDHVFSASPAAGSRIVFNSKGRSGSPGSAYVFESDAVIQFKLGVPSLTAADAQELRLKADHGVGLQPTDPFLRADEPAGRQRVQFIVDAATATVTFVTMENFSLDLNQARSPSELASMGIDTGGKAAVPIDWKVGRMGERGMGTAWIPLPLVSIYRTAVSVPGAGAPQQERFFAGPTIAGNRIYLMGASGYLHEVPLDPKSVNPNFPDPAGTGIAGFDCGNTAFYGVGGLRRLRNVAAAAGWPAGEPVATAPVTVSDGILLANTRRGLTTFSSPAVIVADSNRILETSGDSAARVSVDLTLKRRIDRSEFPIPTDPSFANTGGFPILQERRALNRPSVVVKLSRSSSLTSVFYSSSLTVPDRASPGIAEHSPMADESYLIAETGNNRCVELNPGGSVVWEAEQFQDPLGLLPAGESLRLSGPTDVQRWVESELHPTLGDLVVVHTLITDAGNNRVLELVDKIKFQRGVYNADSFVYTPNQTAIDGQPIRWYHVLVWSSQTSSQGLKLQYRSAKRISWVDGNGSVLLLNRSATGGPLGGGSRPAETVAPYLPPEQTLTYTMATVSGQQVVYPEPPSPGGASLLQGYFRFFPSLTRAVAERIPELRTGGDSVVFLRGRWTVDERSLSGPAPNPLPTPYREPRVTSMGMPVGGTTFRWGQGVIDPNIPILNEIWDEVVDGVTIDPAVGMRAIPVHRLSGVTSVQRIVRSDGKFAPETYNPAQVMDRGQYFLIADQDGVWEARMLPGVQTPPAARYQGANQAPQFRLAWAFTRDDYAYCTGAGNGNPLLLSSPNPTNHIPGGRQLTAASARWLPNGLVLVTSPTPENRLPPGPGPSYRHQNVGADIFLLRPIDYRTAKQRQLQGSPVPYNRTALIDGARRPLHGWQPDLWVQEVFAGLFASGSPAENLAGAPSIRWHASEPINVLGVPNQRIQIDPNIPAGNPYELSNSYLPIQPSFADLILW
jgi:hypothetical protein